MEEATVFILEVVPPPVSGILNSFILDVKPPIPEGLPEGMGFLVPAHSLGLSQVMPVTTSQALCIHCREILRTTSSKASSLGIRSKTSPTCTLTILNAIRLGTLPYRPSQFTWSWNIEASSFMVLREELIPATAKPQCQTAMR